MKIFAFIAALLIVVPSANATDIGSRLRRGEDDIVGKPGRNLEPLKGCRGVCNAFAEKGCSENPGDNDTACAKLLDVKGKLECGCDGGEDAIGCIEIEGICSTDAPCCNAATSNVPGATITCTDNVCVAPAPIECCIDYGYNGCESDNDCCYFLSCTDDGYCYN